MKKLLLFISSLFIFAGCVGQDLIVHYPLPGSEIQSPLKINGQARGTWFFEGSFSIAVVDLDGNKIAEGIAFSEGDWMTEDYVIFNSEIPFEISEEKVEAKLIFDAANPSDLPENEKSFEMPIVLVVGDPADGGPADEEPPNVTVNVYFSNTTDDPEFLDCTKVYPVERVIPADLDPKMAAINELLQGPDAEEEAQGFFTSINEGVSLNSLYIENGTAIADFSAVLNERVGGSCLVTNIRSQIENTLLQFDDINEVVISIDGQSEDILQP